MPGQDQVSFKLGPGLAEAIAALYATFDYPDVPCEDDPTCAVSPFARNERRSLGRRGLPEWALNEFIIHAGQPLCPEEDFKHLLPRMLELRALGVAPHYGGPDFRHLAQAAFRQWPVHERAALDSYFQAYWEDRLASYPHPTLGSSVAWLFNISMVQADIRPYLAAWIPLATEPAASHPQGEPERASLPTLARLLHLADLVAEAQGPISRGKSLALPGIGQGWGFSWDAEHERQIVAWLLSPALSRSVEQAVEDHYDSPAAGALATCYDQLSWMH